VIFSPDTEALQFAIVIDYLMPLTIFLIDFRVALFFEFGALFALL
jgi:hypothetical protein